MSEARIFTKSGLQTAVSAAVSADRRRIAAIMGLPDATGREQLALTLATTTDQTVDQVKAALKAAASAIDSDRKPEAPIVRPSTDNRGDGVADASALWDASLKSRGFKIA